MARTLLRLFDQTKPGTYNTGIKKEVRIATTAAITLATTALTAIDGITPVAGDRVLVKNQAAPAENGIYIASLSAWARATDSDETGEVFSGEVVFVSEGTANGGTGWILTTAGTITVATTSQTWAKFTTMNSLTAANFITGELPSGTINGSNTAFTLANTPTAGSVRLFYNGQRLRVGATEDYTISGAAITMLFAPKSSPSQTDILVADYMI